jgi:hypothetical protein
MDNEDTNGNTAQGQDVTEDVTAGTSGEGNTDTGGHPAWKEILDQLPEEFHPLVTPKLEAWDSGVQTRFQNLQSQYEPYKTFIEQEVDPDYLVQAAQLAAAIEQDPERVYKALAEAYGYGQGVADTTEVTDPDDTDDPDDPIAARLAEHERMLERMAEAYMADQNARETQEGEAVLDEYMAALHEAYPKGFDDQYVLNQIAAGVDGQDAVEGFYKLVESYGGNVNTADTPSAPSAPPVMSSGGGSPSDRVDPRKLGNADTEQLVAELLRAANEE